MWKSSVIRGTIVTVVPEWSQIFYISQKKNVEALEGRQLVLLYGRGSFLILMTFTGHFVPSTAKWRSFFSLLA